MKISIKQMLRKIFATIASFFIQLLQGIASLFEIKPRQPEPGPVAASAPTALQSLDRDESYDAYVEQLSGLDDVVVKMGLHKRISAGHQYMYEMGRRDGALGVSLSNLLDIAKATAQEIFRHIYVIVKGHLAAKRAERDTQKEIMEYDEKVLQRDQAYYDYVSYQYRFFPRSHSWGLAVLYLLIALALVLADIPLALRLIRDGFNLTDSEDPTKSFTYLFLGDFWSIIAFNWETFITALGISLCTIFIKIFYDDFIGTPYANKLMTFKRFVEENNLQSEVMSEKEIHGSIEKEYSRKRYWKIGLAGFTVLTIVVLAFFRLETAGTNGEFVRSFFSDAAFVMITILFPVIGGICLSHSLTNAQNMLRLRTAKNKCERSRKNYLAAVERYAIYQKQYEDLAAADNRLCDEEKMVDEYQHYLVAFYRRGFCTGGMQPEKYAKGEDFYSKILEWRNVAISRKINHHISKLN